MKIPRKILKKIALKMSVYLTVLAMLVNISSPALYTVALAVENNEVQKEAAKEAEAEAEDEEGESEEELVEQESSEDESSEGEEIAEEESATKEEEPMSHEVQGENPVNQKSLESEEDDQGVEPVADGNNGSVVDPIDELVVEKNESAIQGDDSDNNKEEIGKWKKNKDGSMSIVVQEEEEYEYKDSGLKIEFKKIEGGTGEIKVEEIELTDEQVKKLGAISNKAWDITSEMENGTFEYKLTLPTEEDQEINEGEIKMVYLEEKDDLEKLDEEGKIKEVDKEDVEINNERKEIKADNLDHFTVFLATYLDVNLSINSNTFVIGETIYTQATGLLNNENSYYKITIFDSSQNNKGSSNCINNVATLEYSYLIESEDNLGTWKAVIDEYEDSICNKSITSEEKQIEIISINISEPWTVEGSCMEDLYGKKLNCTANDAPTIDVDNFKIKEGDSCESPDDQVTFTANWKLQSNASQRYNVGLYFPIEGQSSALNGKCSISSLPNYPVYPTGEWYNFDGNICGDMASSSILYPQITLTVDCLDTDGDNKLNIPYCVSWDNQASSCDSPLDTIPGTSSKCGCNDGFEIPITVPYAAEIQVIKELIPNNNFGRFNLQIDGIDRATNIGDGGSTGKVIVGAGTSDNPIDIHTVGETEYSGTNLNDYVTSISCVDRGLATFNGGDALIFSGTGPLNVPVEKDDDIVCTITNTYKSGTIEIVKNTKGGDGTFDFLTTGGGNLPGSFNISTSSGAGNQIYGNLVAGAYTVSEVDLPMGWKFEDLSCESSGDSDITINEKTANINLVANDYVTCTYNNSKKGTLTIYKNVTNDNGGNLQPSAFQLYLKKNEVNVLGSPFAGSNTGTIFILDSGTYVVSEDSQDGYLQQSIVCDDQETDIITVDYGDSKICTITNNDQSGTLIVEKNLINNNNGQKFCQDFSFSYNSSGLISFEEDCRNEITVPAGIYNVTESVAIGYDTTHRGCSDINIPNGGSATCTITNDDQPGKLIVKKVLVKDDGGNESYSDFSFKINEGEDKNFEFDGENEYTVDAGTYTIVENSREGYTATYNNCENISIANGETETCTITNNDKAPSITLNKEVINNNGGTAGVNDFGLSIGNTTVNSGQTLPVLANTPYAINEIGLAGYEFVSITGDDKCPSSLDETVTLDEGENITCTITNDDKPGKLTVYKFVNNQFGGNLESNNFTINVSGTNVSPSSFSGSSNGTLVTLDAGYYEVSENEISGYVPRYSEDCTGNIEIGEIKNCTITNDDKAPTLTLIKKVINDNGGDKTVSDFSLFFNENQVTSGEAVTLESNKEYAVSETNLFGYTPSDWTGDCSADGKITLNPGQNATCYITNDDIQPKLTVNKIVNNGPFGELRVEDFDLYVGANQVTSGEQNGFNAGVYSISESLEIGYEGVISVDCSENGNIILESGDVKSCTITNTDNFGKIIIKKQTLPNTDSTTEFSFSGTGIDDGAKLKNGEIDEKIVVSGSYSISEIVPAGWDLTDITCIEDGIENSGASISEDDTADINLEAGETVSCEFTNTKRGTITIEKDAVPNDPRDFEFTNNFGNNNPATFYLDDDNGNETLPKTRTFEVLPGVYNVSEESVSGWKLSSATCDNDDSINEINVGPGENIKCTFVNRKLGSITIVKETIGGDGTFDFEMTGQTLPETAQILTSSNTGSETFNSIDPENSYSISERDKDGWNKTNVYCENNYGTEKDPTSFQMPNGGSVMCTFTNTKLNPLINILKNSITTEITTAGQLVPYTFIVTNEGNQALTDVTVIDPMCDVAPLYISGDTDLNSSLDLNEAWTYTCNHTVSQAEIDAGGNLSNTVTVYSNESDPDTDDFEIPIIQSPALSLVKTATQTTYDQVGDVINYSFLVTNSGNVSLTGPVIVDDDKATDESCPNVNTVGNEDEKLDPGESITCTASYTINQADLNTGTVTNIASATADRTTSNTDTETVNAEQSPALSLVKTATQTTYDQVGDVINYSFLVTNSGNVSLTGPVIVDDDKATDESCPNVNTVGNEDEKLDPGESITCTASYTINQADLNTGTVTNIASATADRTTSNTDTETVNAELTDIHGYKWNDLDGDGERSCVNDDGLTPSIAIADYQEGCELEPLLEGWIINLYKWNDGGYESEPIKTMETSTEEGNHFGWYRFEDLLPGKYQVCEVVKSDEGWGQTAPGTYQEPKCYEVSLPNDCNERFDRIMASDYVETYCQYNFGNQFVRSALTVSKTNNEYANGPDKPGDLVTYTIKVQARENGVRNAVVTDLPPETFEYVAGSWTASSSIHGSISIPEPTYASPGDWNLGDMKKDEVITLTYQARIGEETKTGVYPDLAWAQGENLAGEKLIALSVDSDFSVNQGIVDENFVGTQIEVEAKEVPPTVKVRADRDEVIEEVEKEVKVLGAAFPATGASNNWLLTALMGMFLGSLLVGSGYLIKNRRKMKISKILGILAGVILTGFFAGSASAAGISVRLSEPDNKTASAFNLEFVAMDIQNRAMIAECQKKYFSDADFVQFGSDIELKVGGDSALCRVDSSVLTESGDYDFRVVVTADGGEEKISNMVETYYDGVGPEKPKYIKKKDENSCSNEIEFRTANDGQTAYVEIYRSQHTRNIVANEDSLRITIIIGPNKKNTFRDGTSSTGCGDNYFYAIRAFDDAGNASGVRAEVFRDVIEEKKIIEVFENQEGVELNFGNEDGSQESQDGQEGQEGEEDGTEEEDATVTDEGAQTEGTENDAEVLGEQDDNGYSLLKDWRFWLAVISIAGLGWFFYNRR